MQTEDIRTGHLPASQDETIWAREELERLLQDASFRGSKRYPAMLRYVVERTLDGEHGDLKERTIGIDVFGRTPAYDTATDPVVRFSAGEIRKRLAQIYEREDAPARLHIELPLGTYVPSFLWACAEAASPETVRPAPAVSPASSDETGLEEKVHTSSRRWARALLIAAAVLALAIVSVVRLTQTAKDPVHFAWKPLLQTPDPVVLSVGQPFDSPTTEGTQKTMSLDEHLTASNFRVSIPTAHVIAEIAAFLREQRKGFDLHGAEMNSLSTLHRKPVVLVGAIDNKWTRVMLEESRFRFVSLNTTSYIEDASRPNFKDWRVDFRQPYLRQTVDYAIFARFQSPLTNAPVMVLAGLGPNGNEAATEFALDDASLRTLFKQAPKNWSGANFEAVLRVDVVDGDTGGATVVASHFW